MDPAVPERTETGFTGGQQLLGLRATAPPDDVFFDGVEFLEGAIQIQRIELVGGNTVGQQGQFQYARARPFVQRTFAREGFGVEQCVPVFRGRSAELALVVTEDKGEEERADAVIGDETR